MSDLKTIKRKLWNGLLLTLALTALTAGATFMGYLPALMTFGATAGYVINAASVFLSLSFMNLIVQVKSLYNLANQTHPLPVIPSTTSISVQTQADFTVEPEQGVNVQVVLPDTLNPTSVVVIDAATNTSTEVLEDNDSVSTLELLEEAQAETANESDLLIDMAHLYAQWEEAQETNDIVSLKPNPALEKVQADCKRLAKEKKDIKTLLTASDKSIQILLSEKRLMESNVLGLKESLRESRQETDAAKSTITGLEANLVKALEENTRTHSEIDRLHWVLGKKKVAAKDLDQKRKRKDLASKNIVTSLRHERDDARLKINELLSSVSAHQEEVKSLTTQMEVMKRGVHKAELSLSSALRALTADLERAQAEKHESALLIESLRLQIQDTDTALNEALATIAMQDECIERLEALRKSADAEVTTNQQTLERYQQDLEYLSKRSLEAEKSKQNACEDSDLLRKAFDELRAEVARREPGAVPANGSDCSTLKLHPEDTAYILDKLCSTSICQSMVSVPYTPEGSLARSSSTVMSTQSSASTTDASTMTENMRARRKDKSKAEASQGAAPWTPYCSQGRSLSGGSASKPEAQSPKPGTKLLKK